MKKKIALILAIIMGITVFMPTTVLAATGNYVDNKPVVPGNTLFYEHGLLATDYLTTNPNYANNKNEPEYYCDGTDLVLPLMGAVNDGFEFKLTLSNSKWFFRSAHRYRTTDAALDLSTKTAAVPIDTIERTVPIANKDYSGLETDPTRSPLVVDRVRGTPGITYDPDKGYYHPRSDVYGNYYRVPMSRVSGTNTIQQLPYKLEVSA